MNYATQGSLRQQHPKGSILTLETVLLYTKQIAGALQYAHQKNVIHCDVKPENILLDKTSHLFLSDFGIALIMQTTLAQSTQGPAGTPVYMAPEQFKGKPQRASDQYALGIMIYEWLYGKPPFQGKTFYELMDKHLDLPIPSLCLKNPSIPAAVETIILKALAKAPQQRFESIEAFARALEEAYPLKPVITIPPSHIEQPLTITKIKSILPTKKNTFNEQSKNYTVLDIGTANARAAIIEVAGNRIQVQGVAQQPQLRVHMADGIITDISGVITNCKVALSQASHIARSRIVPPKLIINTDGELVKATSITVNKKREQSNRVIDRAELESLTAIALEKLQKSAQDRIAAETGYQNVEISFVKAKVTTIHIDGKMVSDPVGFRGGELKITLFATFAPLMQVSALGTVAQGLDLHPIAIVTGAYALASLVSKDAARDRGAILIDIGAGTTDIVLIRQGVIEEARTFALAGLNFTRRIATGLGISLEEAEQLKVAYSKRIPLKRSKPEEVKAMLIPEYQTWMDSVELLIEEMAKGELLPAVVYTVGGGSVLPDLQEQLHHFPWQERLPFARQPIIASIEPDMVPADFSDPQGLFKTTQDITTMALAYQAIEWENSLNDNIDKSLNKIISQFTK